MLVGGELTEAHFRVLLKVAKGCSETDFISAFNNENLPVRLSPKEKKVADSLWGICKGKLADVGLLGIAQAA